VSAQEEWVSSPADPSWLGRLVSPGSSRPGTAPFVMAALGIVAFVVSLAVDWISATGTITQRSRSGSQDAVSYFGISISTVDDKVIVSASNNLTTIDLLGLVYALGGIALITMALAVLSRPDLALRVRMVSAGLGVGVLGVVVAATLRMPTLMVQAGAAYAGGPFNDITPSYHPGIFAAYAAAVLPVVAVWVRSAPAARAAVAEQRARLESSTATGVTDPGPQFAVDPTMANAVAPGGQSSAAAQPASPEGEDAARVWGRRSEGRDPWRDDLPPEPYDLTVTSD
jgi:hypothetical protein